MNKEGNISSNIDNENSLYKKILKKNAISCINLKNINNYQINKDEEEINFERKPIKKYNPIKDGIEIINPPPYKNGKWNHFYEYYFLKSSSKRKFQKTGGFFSEFCNRNITSINNEKVDIKQKLKEINEKMKKETHKKKSEKKENSKKEM